MNEGLKLLTEVVARFSDVSVEKPSVLVKWGEEEIACHRTLLRSKCPELLEKIEGGYCLDEDMEQELNHNMILVFSILSTLIKSSFGMSTSLAWFVLLSPMIFYSLLMKHPK